MSDEEYKPRIGRPPMPEHRQKHGTFYGFQRHLDRKEKPCEECAKFRRQYMREYRSKRKKQKKVLRAILQGGRFDLAKRVKLTQKEADEIIRTLKEELDL